jgi:hypothetical protein
MAGNMIKGAGLTDSSMAFFLGHTGNHHSKGKWFSDPNSTILDLCTSPTAASSGYMESTKHNGFHQ